MSFRIFFRVWSAAMLIAGVLFSGCSRSQRVRAPLMDGEFLRVGATVLIDDIPAGAVQRIEEVGPHRIAILNITESNVIESKLKVGLVRVYDGGTDLRLSTRLVTPDAIALKDGAMVETQSKIEIVARRVSDQRNWGLIGALVTLLGSVGYIAVRLFRLGRFFVALVVAAGVAWVVHPIVIPVVERLYSKMVVNAPGAEKSQLSSTTVSTWEDRLIACARQRPAPRSVALVISFLGCALVTTAAARVLR